MNKTLKTISYFSISFISILFLFIPDDAWLCVKLFSNSPNYLNSITNRLIIFALTFIFSTILVICFERIKWFTNLKSKNYSVQIRYGNILKSRKGLVLINFDECFTTKIGDECGDIKKSSLCGQFLLENDSFDISKLLDVNNVKPELNRRSKYKNQNCYKPGTVLPYCNYLLMAFARLDCKGLAEFDSLNDYLDCLAFLWDQLSIYHSDSNVCVPILGCGRTKIKGRELNQQELLDIMIFSYKLSDSRLKKPNKLIIYCKRDSDFSLNRINKNIY